MKHFQIVSVTDILSVRPLPDTAAVKKPKHGLRTRQFHFKTEKLKLFVCLSFVCVRVPTVPKGLALGNLSASYIIACLIFHGLLGTAL